MKYLITAAALVVVALSTAEGADDAAVEARSAGNDAESRYGYYDPLNSVAYPGSYGSLQYPGGRYCYGGSSLSGDLGLCDNPYVPLPYSPNAYPYSGRPYYGNPLYGNPMYGNPALNPLYGNGLYGNPAYNNLYGSGVYGNPLVGRPALIG